MSVHGTQPGADFSFAGKPARGLAGIKQLVFGNSHCHQCVQSWRWALPSAAEKTSINVEDALRSGVVHALGLACPVVDWTELGMDSGAERTAGSHFE